MSGLLRVSGDDRLHDPELGLKRSSWRGCGECEVALEAEELEGRLRLDAGHGRGPAGPLHVQPERDQHPGRPHRHHQQLESCGRRRRLEAWSFQDGRDEQTSAAKSTSACSSEHFDN